MIEAMDEMLLLWARDMHGGLGAGNGAGDHQIARLMACKGELIRGSRGGSRMLLPYSADIELIVNKHLEARLAVVVREQYLNKDPYRLESQKWAACGCGRSQFYELLHSAHVAIGSMLLERVA